VAAWLVRFALRAQDRAHAGAVSAAADRLAAGNPGFGALAAAAAHARGLLRRDPAALRQAATSSCDPWTRASAAEDLSLLLREQKDFAGATLSLEESLTGYERTAASRDARRVRRRLRGLGIRRRHCTYANRPRSGWESLTDTERSVSALVAQGLTNQKIASEMFLSPHTVAFHLRQVFRKLDIGSRVDLARQLTERSRPGVQPDLMPARLVQKPVAQAMTTWLRRRGAGLWVPKELVDVQRLSVRLGVDERLQLGRQLLENAPGLSSGEALGQGLQGRLGGALGRLPAQPVTGPPNGLDDLLVVHSALRGARRSRPSLGSLRLSLGPLGSHRIPRPARTRGGDGDRGQLPDRRMCGDGRPANLSVDCRSTGFPHKESSDDNHN
jgi:DNA-binding CsgD family transcriptional regulator